jgi:hypothetical protein
VNANGAVKKCAARAVIDANLNRMQRQIVEELSKLISKWQAVPGTLRGLLALERR